MTLQKIHIFGVLKAQGFTNGYLAKAVVAQTVILSVFGTMVGLILTLITGRFLPDAVPIVFEGQTLGLFSVVLIGVSVLGGLCSITTIRHIDPLEAIG